MELADQAARPDPSLETDKDARHANRLEDANLQGGFFVWEWRKCDRNKKTWLETCGVSVSTRLSAILLASCPSISRSAQAILSASVGRRWRDSSPFWFCKRGCKNLRAAGFLKIATRRIACEHEGCFDHREISVAPRLANSNSSRQGPKGRFADLRGRRHALGKNETAYFFRIRRTLVWCPLYRGRSRRSHALLSNDYRCGSLIIPIRWQSGKPMDLKLVEAMKRQFADKPTQELVLIRDQVGENHSLEAGVAASELINERDAADSVEQTEANNKRLRNPTPLTPLDYLAKELPRGGSVSITRWSVTVTNPFFDVLAESKPIDWFTDPGPNAKCPKCGQDGVFRRGLPPRELTNKRSMFTSATTQVYSEVRCACMFCNSLPCFVAGCDQPATQCSSRVVVQSYGSSTTDVVLLGKPTKDVMLISNVDICTCEQHHTEFLFRNPLLLYLLAGAAPVAGIAFCYPLACFDFGLNYWIASVVASLIFSFGVIAYIAASNPKAPLKEGYTAYILRPDGKYQHINTIQSR